MSLCRRLTDSDSEYSNIIRRFAHECAISRAHAVCSRVEGTKALDLFVGTACVVLGRFLTCHATPHDAH